MHVNARFRGISGSTLKLLGCLFMLIDHVGVFLFPNVILLRIIGRLAMPIFAFFIAEGCRYTRHKLRHFLLIFCCGMLFYVGAGIVSGVWKYNIFLTFSVSVLFIYLWQWCFRGIVMYRETDRVRASLYIAVFLAALVGGYVFFQYFPLEYGYPAMLLPVVLSATHLRPLVTEERLLRWDCHPVRLLLTAGMLLAVSIPASAYIQYFCLLALPFLALYNGQVGTRRLKYFFYLFYPVHIIVLFLLQWLFLLQL